MRIRIVLQLGLLSVLSAPMLAQADKTLLIDRPRDDDPVRVVKVMERAKEILPDGAHYANKYAWEGVIEKADDDWLTGLSLAIQNASAKKIVYIIVSCNVTETANWDQDRLTRLAKSPPEPLLGQINNHVGLRPETALYSARLKRRLHPDIGPAFELAPGAIYTIAMENPDYYPALKSSVEERKGSVSAANGCNGRISQVFFGDGTQWQGHHYYRADPNDPRYWVRMSSEEWAGKSQ
jgi:hypothetical protein